MSETATLRTIEKPLVEREGEKRNLIYPPFIAIIAGPSCVGKSTVSEALAHPLNDKEETNIVVSDVDTMRRSIFGHNTKGTPEQEQRAMEQSYAANHAYAKARVLGKAITKDGLPMDAAPVILTATYSRAYYHEMAKELLSWGREHTIPSLFFQCDIFNPEKSSY